MLKRESVIHLLASRRGAAAGGLLAKWRERGITSNLDSPQILTHDSFRGSNCLP